MIKQYQTLTGLLVFLFISISACSDDSSPDNPSLSTSAAVPARASLSAAAVSGVGGDDCQDEQGLVYLCGPQAAEDLLALGDSGLLLASGMSSATVPGQMFLIDPDSMEYEELIHGRNYSAAQDMTLFSECPGPVDTSNFSVHGLSVKATAPLSWRVYTTSHGAREAIEIYDLWLGGNSPTLTWKGCVELPANTFANSVAQLSDDGFVTTKMMDPAQGFAAISAGNITGNVYTWNPGRAVFNTAGTELSGANGIAVSATGRFMYVAAFGSRELVRFDRSHSPAIKTAVTLDIVPDNVRWTRAGTLLVAGNNYVAPEVCSGQGCATGWSVLEIDPETLAVQRIAGADQNASLQGVSSALLVGKQLWIGSFNDDRVGYFTLP